MANIVANVVNGQIADSSKSSAAKNSAIGATSAKDRAVDSNSVADKDTFLKLLAAEMQYQDPLSPTDNTQYVSEMATFSQVEATTNVSNTVESMQAQSLAGKYATVRTEDGSTTVGLVEEVTKSDDSYKLKVDGVTYNLSDVLAIQDASYYEAVQNANTFGNMISELPEAENLSLANESALKAARSLYDSLSSYQKKFVNSADLATLTSLEQRMSAIRKADSASGEE